MTKSDLEKNPEKILIVDDEHEICETLAEFLSQYFKEVRFTSNSEEALKFLTNENFDLIISDLMMPQLKGNEMIALLRSKGRLTPVIFISGAASKEDAINALRLNAADFIEKPFSEDYILKSVLKALELERRTRELYSNLIAEKDKQKLIESQKKMIGLLEVSRIQKD